MDDIWETRYKKAVREDDGRIYQSKEYERIAYRQLILFLALREYPNPSALPLLDA